MDETEYLKCPCKECGSNVEYPVSAAGTTVACPHCGQWTELAAIEEPAKAVNLGGLIIGAVVILIIAAAGGWMYFRTPETKTPQVPKPVAKAAVPPSNPPPANVATQVVVQTPSKPKSKSSADLKIGAVTLEKTTGSSLVYAVGTVVNDSDWQRFGVKVELDVINLKGQVIGKARDQKSVIEPRQDWQFHALIPNPDAVAAKLSSLTEGE